jgi:hypothetical protein
MVSEAIATGDVQAINYFVAQKYVDALKAIAAAPNQKILFMPLESSGVIGALGGIAEIARDAFNGGGAPGGSPPPRAPRRRVETPPAPQITGSGGQSGPEAGGPWGQ